ncbi:hypothetical protein HU200_055167 [Digitaria exilis]|uniref:Uncharacterized protein n=1 Tax=Digitaria exilis TaxID=1010633 RepID=A0A835AP54_9POAL|nr:hypothetical protein HU200_055167 [Digitaria exilis]
MASLASMLAGVARRASARSASLAARSGNTGEALILGWRSIAAVHPQSKLTGDASPKRLIQFGCAYGVARRQFHGVDTVEGNQPSVAKVV